MLCAPVHAGVPFLGTVQVKNRWSVLRFWLLSGPGACCLGHRYIATAPEGLGLPSPYCPASLEPQPWPNCGNTAKSRNSRLYTATLQKLQSVDVTPWSVAILRKERLYIWKGVNPPIRYLIYGLMFFVPVPQACVSWVFNHFHAHSFTDIVELCSQTHRPYSSPEQLFIGCCFVWQLI